VVGDDDFGVPAGWYPDPLGLPQLRWWDGQSWTEFTSEAQAPVMMEPVAFVPEPAMAATRAEPIVAETTASYAAASAFVETASVVTPAAQPVVEPVFAPAEQFVPAAAVLTEPAVNVHNLGEEIQFLTRRERREYERRLEAEAALFPHSVDASAAPAAYIQQPVVPDVAQTVAAEAAFVGASTFVFPTEPLVAEPLQPEPMYSQFEQPVAEPLRATTSFADLINGAEETTYAETVVASGAAGVVVEPPMFVAPGLRELEPALSDILAEAALAPSATYASSTSMDSGFSIDETVVEEASAPRSRVMTKRTYTGASWFLACSSAIQLAFAYLVVVVMNQPENRAVVAVIWFGGLVVAAGIAGYDRLQLRAAGHERPATGWWALLTPLAYLIARWTRTRTETGRGGLLIIVWVIITAAVVAYLTLDPILFLAAVQ
jgi:hypothetical protein